MKEILQDFSPQELEALVLEYGEQKFRAKQIFQGLMQGKKLSELPVPASLREKLLERFEDEPVRIREVFTSSDGTKKYLFALADGNLIEGVLMHYKYGATQCVSTQVGCRMGCKFCASTLNGLIRNLTAGEILSEILVVNRAEGGIHISARNISLSTCGLVPKMLAFAKEGIPLNLTVSLHASTDEERARTMPVANAYKIADILNACDVYFKETGRRYIFEYSLIGGENSDEKHAHALAALLKGRPCHVNLIRLNEVKERSLKTVTEKDAYRFLGMLEKEGISATLRRSMGNDIGGACGQLRASYLKEQESKE